MEIAKMKKQIHFVWLRSVEWLRRRTHVLLAQERWRQAPSSQERCQQAPSSQERYRQDLPSQERFTQSRYIAHN